MRSLTLKRDQTAKCSNKVFAPHSKRAPQCGYTFGREMQAHGPQACFFLIQFAARGLRRPSVGLRGMQGSWIRGHGSEEGSGDKGSLFKEQTGSISCDFLWCNGLAQKQTTKVAFGHMFAQNRFQNSSTCPSHGSTIISTRDSCRHVDVSWVYYSQTAFRF